MTCTQIRKMNASVLSLLIPFFAAVLCDDDPKAVKLRFYHSSFEEYTAWPIEEAHKIFSKSWYNSSKTTVVFCYGYTGRPTGPAVTAVVKAYLEQGESNVALLDWQYEASAALSSFAGSYLNWAAPNARQLGKRFSDVLVRLSDSGLNISNTHFVGHSLGAQIFGIAGYELRQKGIILPRITGLDPASVGFETKPAPMKLSPYSARVVIVIHSDPSKYGCKGPAGTVDFWPNYNIGLVIQPGCVKRPVPVFTEGDLCNHNRCWQLFVEAIRNPSTVIGSLAKNYRVWKHYSVDERNAVTLSLNPTDLLSVKPGNYFFVTTSASPYGLGKDGL